MLSTSLLVAALLLTQTSCKNMNNTTKGGVIGAGTGAAIGGIIGHHSGNTAVGAIIGAAAGGTAARRPSHYQRDGASLRHHRSTAGSRLPTLELGSDGHQRHAYK